MTYYQTQETDGTEDIIQIHAPDGRVIATIAFWDDADLIEWSKQRMADAKLIVDALNMYKPQTK